MKNSILAGGCRSCICETCFLKVVGRCPYGGCYDDKRAVDEPYHKMHPNEPPRKTWSTWKTDQGFWCRGGTFFPAASCQHYVKCKGCQVGDCLRAVVLKYQDGTIRCGLGDHVDCEQCYRQFMESLEKSNE